MAAKKTTRSKARKTTTRAKATRKTSVRASRKAPGLAGPKQVLWTNPDGGGGSFPPAPIGIDG